MIDILMGIAIAFWIFYMAWSAYKQKKLYRKLESELEKAIKENTDI